MKSLKAAITIKKKERNYFRKSTFSNENLTGNYDKTAE